MSPIPEMSDLVSPQAAMLAARRVVVEQREAVQIVARAALDMLDAGDAESVRRCLNWLAGEGGEAANVPH